MEPKRRGGAEGGGIVAVEQRRHGQEEERSTPSLPLNSPIVEEEGQKEELVGDLTEDGQKIVVAKGGRGGLGNVHFASATNQVPQTATGGKPGEERHLSLRLKLLVDVCIVGSPNAGKSSLLTKISQARPKIADYPFTSVEPVLGVVEVGKSWLVVADMPGIVKGAHLGHGIGNDFLRHAERGKAIIHLLDGSSPCILDDLRQVNAELGLFDSSLLQKPQIVVVNKVDLPEVRERITEIEDTLGGLDESVFFVSALTGEGIDGLMAMVAGVVETERASEKEITEKLLPVLRPQPKGEGRRRSR